MGSTTFIGGIHPHEGKGLSENKPVQVLMPKSDLVYPMSQYASTLAKPLAAKDNHVLAGQKTGEAGGFISASVTASVPGAVKTIGPRRMANGATVPSVVIENDGEYKIVKDVGKDRDPSDLSKEEVRNTIKKADIVGFDGAGSPAYVKLVPKDENAIKHILANGTEREPCPTNDYRTMLEEPERIVGGLKVILQLFDSAKGVIGIENNKPEAIKKLTEVMKDELRITACPSMTKYLQGEERSLIHTVIGREVNSSMLPADARCTVDGIDTVISIYAAVCKCTPLTRKIITVTGDAVADPRNFSVKLGINYQELLGATDSFKAGPEKVPSGGPMVGQAISDLNIPVSKASPTLTCFTKNQVTEMKPPACIQCGKYVSVRPSHIIPVTMMQTALRDDCEIFGGLNGTERMGYRNRTYICPAKRSLIQAFKEMRKTVVANRRKKGQEGA